MIYKKHIFICTNRRPPGARVCCGEERGSAITAEFKKIMKSKGLTVDMRAQIMGCCELCEQGPIVVVYPDGVFYGKVGLEDVEEIISEHVENNRVVERLRISRLD